MPARWWLFVDGVHDEVALIELVCMRCALGADPQQTVYFLHGLMQTAPEQVWSVAPLLEAFDMVVGAWDDAAFNAHLPDVLIRRCPPTRKIQRQELVRSKAIPCIYANFQGHEEHNIALGKQPRAAASKRGD